MSANFDLATIRIFLHVLGVTVWVGGQIVMMALLPVLRAAEIEGLAAKAAQAFQGVAWPAMALAIFTGIWNIFAVDMENATTGYNITFGIKFLFVIISGVSAYVHSKTDKPSVRGMTGAAGFVSAIIAMFLGFAL